LLSRALFGYIRAEFSIGWFEGFSGLLPDPAVRFYRVTGSNPEKGEFQ